MRSIKVNNHDKYVRAIFITQKEMDSISMLGGTSGTKRKEIIPSMFPTKDLTPEQIYDLSNVMAKLFFSVGDSRHDPDSENLIKYAEKGEE